MRLFTSTLLLCFLYAGRCLAQSLNPCDPVEPKDVQRGKGYVVGLAYWPGGTLQMWGNASMGLHPCYDTATLAAAGVTVASFRLKADTMTVLRTSRRDEAQLYDKRSTGLNLMSVIAFAGKYRSDARYIWSDEPLTTGGTGVVDAQALIIDFDKGAVKTLKWQNMGCVDCATDLCVVSDVDAKACATNFVSQCSCAVANNTVAPCQNPDDFPQACHTGIQVATSGSDKNAVAFTSGVQLQKISGLSLTKLYINSKNQLGSTFEGIKTNATGGVFNQN